MKTRENEMHPQMLALMSNVWGAFQIRGSFVLSGLSHLEWILRIYWEGADILDVPCFFQCRFLGAIRTGGV
jgi:predicted lipoprotein